MIDHLTTYATDFSATKAFYDAALGALGYTVQMEMTTTWDPDFPTRRLCAFGPANKPQFWISEVKEASSPRHVAFSASEESAVRAFYDAALASGGVDNGPPGPREHYHPGYFGAFVLDPDGNNVEAVFHGAPV